MNVYELRQNNSGGVFIGPTYVLIQADSEEQALVFAESHPDSPVYFRGVLRGTDCECCGDRWYRNAWEVPADEVEGYNPDTTLRLNF